MSKTRSTQRRGIGYVRVSRVNNRDKTSDGASYHTVEIQRAAIEELARAKSIEIVEWYVDENQSGGKSDRPEFERALRALDDGIASVMLVSKMSRFARSAHVAHETLKRIERSNAQLIAGDLDIDTTTKAGRFMRGILVLIAEWELDGYREEWAEVRAIARSNNVWSRRVPHGYVRDADKSLVRDPATADLVRELFKRRASGASWVELLNYWHSHDGPPISRTGMRTLIANRAYLGEDREGDDVDVESHDPLVSVEEFNAAQDAFERPLYAARSIDGPSMLAGILHCVSCGRPMTTGRQSKKRGGARLYVCSGGAGRASETRCPRRMSLMLDLADAAVETLLREHVEDIEAESVAPDRSQLDAALRDLEAAESDLVAYLAKRDESSRPDLWASAIDEREERIEAAQSLVDELRQTSRDESLRTSLYSLWPDLSASEKRKIINGTIERIDVHPASTSLGGLAKTATVERRIELVAERLQLVPRD